jgi:SAM-dependent methyltransferase
MADFERIEPGTVPWATYYGNHIARYQFAAGVLGARRVSGRVLDAACGAGYGSHHLATTLGCDVTGVDRDDRALAIAAGRFAHPRVLFRRDDCHTLAAAAEDGPFAAVVSFETLEHLPDPAAFLRASRRLLAPRGVLVCSTPNANVTSPAGTVGWEFHEREFKASELAALVGAAGFGDVALFGQQLTPMGRLRDELRSELNTLRSNPFDRLGAWVQRRVRGRSIEAPLPERAGDFEFVPRESPASIDALGIDGPFVIVAVAVVNPA